MTSGNDALRLELLTSAEIAKAIDAGVRSIILPCGAVEQHGAHLPLSVDADHADYLGILLAQRLEKTLVAPTIRVGCSTHHMVFPGTISLRDETFEMIVQDYCTSLARHGFERIFIFTAHVGNCPPLAAMLPRLRLAVPEPCRVIAYTNSRAWLETWRDAVAEAGGEPIRVGGHADLAETSVMLDIHPERVRVEAYEAGRLGLLSQSDLELMWREGLRAVSANGILGDPNGSTVSIGRRCIERIAALLLEGFAEQEAAYQARSS
ncbi:MULTISPECIES: creatininase family protein [unclassified Sphingobium]|uniref:creatininase family protein n=1 Tax=unclassified Sphingobium TaxID=2611147 RepID=UPI00076FF6FB|nr:MULTISPECIES: creatininase family protein [unclassified Sphingobium]AMK24343.1 creatininase [Sphingobium sp. TKS]NML90413.1 creatininase family protein [Sphingobium sp. TB-6]